MELQTCRQIGFSLGPIPITAIWAYADRYSLDEGFVYLIQRIDADYLSRALGGSAEGEPDPAADPAPAPEPSL